ncbi:MAG: EamA family transporter [Arenicellales bacterium]
MSTTVTLLILLAALFHALWNAFAKKSSDPLISIAGMAMACGLTAALTLPFIGLPETRLLPWIAVSIAIHTVYMIALSQAYRYGDFSLAYPIARGTAPAIVVIFSLFFLKEELQASQLIAVSGILFGILLFALRRFNEVLADHRSLGYALLTACLIATYTLIDGAAVRLAQKPLNFIAWTLFLQAFPIFFYMLYQQKPHTTRGVFKAIRNDMRLIIFGGILAFVGYSIVLWAMTQAPIALVAAFRETSIIIAALIGMIWLKEPSGWRRILAAAIIFLSVVYLKLA